MGLFSILKDKTAGAEPSDFNLAEEHTVAARAKSEFVPKQHTHFTEAARWCSSTGQLLAGPALTDVC